MIDHEPGSDRERPAEGRARLVAGGLMIACCASTALVIALAGSVAAATVLGVGVGTLLVVALLVLAALRLRAHGDRRPPGAARVRADGTRRR